MKPITLKGRVEENNEPSSTIGCTVATIAIGQGAIIPAQGVYFSETEFSGKKFNSISWINNGRDGKTLRLEVHLLDLSEDLSNKFIYVTLLKKVRDIISFPGDEEMKRIIEFDLGEAREWFENGD